MIGTTTALILGGAALGGNLIGAKMQSSAANKAAKTQTQAADRALALQERVYNESRQQLSPYVSMGAHTLQGLSALANRQAPGFNGAQYAKGGVTAAPSMAPMSAPAPQGLGMLRSVGSGQTPATAAAAPRMVMVQAPTGEQREVPFDQAQRFVAKGARIVGSPRGQAVQERV